jgi:D-arabinose 1-dehydrogenase-like Zn-dependent alcohol dehydrogenase
VNCQNPVVSGVTVDGGYAEVMIAEARAITSIPDELTSAEAAPLLKDLGAHVYIDTGLAARGKLIVVGVPEAPIQLNAFPLVFGGRSISGSLTGTPIDSEDTLAFCVLENIRPMIEIAPLEQAADAYARMMQGKARFRMVLVTKTGAAQSSPVN